MPTEAPPYGVCLPVTYCHCRDGQTVVVRLRSNQVLAVQLLGCKVPRRDVTDPAIRAKGREAANYLHRLLLHSDEVAAFLPLSESEAAQLADGYGLPHKPSADPIPGRIFGDGRDVAQVLVEHGFATKAPDTQG